MSTSFGEIFNGLLKKAPEIAINKVISEVERALEEPLQLRKADVSRGRQIVPHLVRSHASRDWVKLPRPPGRGAFLAAARRFLADKDDEWALVGLGTVARRSYVREAFVVRGRAGSVGIPASVQAEIRGHLEATTGAEIIHVHNHPQGVARDIKNLFLGEAPVTSDADRQAERAHSAVAREAAFKSLELRKVRFFVVENGQIHRYWLPSTGPLRDEADRLFASLLGVR